jgi:phage baseplate assembly protein W
VTERYQAIRFVHPDLASGQAVASAGLQVSARGRLDLVSGDESVRQSLLLLLATSPGERVMRPGYGCHLRRLVFAPNDDTTAGLALHYVRQAVERWEPRIDLLAVDASRDPDAPERLIIELDYRVRDTRRTGQLRYPLDLTG